VAELDGVVVGFGMYGESDSKKHKYTVEHSVYVNNDFQGNWKIVLQELIVLAKKQGAYNDRSY
jgi:phosphinothricin acetyltransferase